MTPDLNKIRRKLLIALSSMPIVGWLNTTWSAEDQEYALASALTNLLQDRSSAQMIGKLYLNITPSEANIEQLLSRILHTNPELQMHMRSNRAVLHEQIKTLQIEDFHKERVVNIDGWILSQTEARLCALKTFI